MFGSFNPFNHSPFLLNKNKVKSGEFALYLPRSNQTIHYLLKPSSRRKTISLELKQSIITVRCPQWLSNQDVENFILTKQNWLTTKLAAQPTQPIALEKYTNGATLLFRGEAFELILIEAKVFSYCFDESEKTLTLAIPNKVTKRQPYVKHKLRDIYFIQAKNYILPRVETLQKSTQLQASAIELKIYKRRWGCCYRSRLIRLNPMLMGAPEWVIDCVIIHELCHLQHMDHSKQFWSLNKTFCCRCDESKQWLQKNGEYLQLN